MKYSGNSIILLLLSRYVIVDKYTELMALMSGVIFPCDSGPVIFLITILHITIFIVLCYPFPIYVYSQLLMVN